MAIRLTDRYPNRVDPATSNYPHGKMRNVSAPGENDGTPLEQDWGNDFNAFFQALVEAAGITPDGTVDTVPDSQYMESLVQVANGVTEVDVAGDTDVSLNTDQARIAMVKLTGTLTGDIDVIFPDTERGYVIINNTSGSFSVTCRTSAGSGLTVPQGGTRWVRSDGANLVAVLNDVSSTVESVATLRTSSFPANLERIYLLGRNTTGDGGQGDFVWDESDLSAEVGNDEVTEGQGDGGIYVAPASDKTGASGAWVRQFTGLPNDLWYGRSRDRSIIQSEGPVITGTMWEYAIRLQAMFEAEAIRRSSGVKADATGIESGVTVGLTDGGNLTTTGYLQLDSESAASSEADSGSGTESDPYVISDRSFDGNAVSGSVAVGVSGSDSYYLVLRNCEFFGWSSACVNARADVNITIENCLFRNLPNRVGLIQSGATDTVFFDRCRFSDIGDDPIRILDGANESRLEMKNCVADESEGSWPDDDGSGNSINWIQCEADGAEIDVSHMDCDVDNIWFAQPFSDCAFTAQFCRIRRALGLWTAQGKFNTHRIRIGYCYADDFNSNSPIIRLLQGGSDIEIHNCYFGDVTEGERQVIIRNPTGCVVHHCHLFRSGSTGGAGNENLEAFYCTNTVFHDCWVENAREDAFEFVEPGHGCSMYNLVADNVPGQMIDWYGISDAVDGQIHHIYGSGRDPVLVTDVSGVTISSIFAAKSFQGGTGSGIVTIEQRNASAGIPDNINIYGYLGLPENSEGNGVLVLQGDVGDVRAAWLEGDELQTEGYSDFSNFQIR